ncbi:hypothetical protein [Streptomyces sp. NPDC057460]|uniref:hypothetical protein n=1 Tax=Streptomyces sp. NPDC057460 TaxID=3346141 RepID=UPI0036CAC66A
MADQHAESDECCGGNMAGSLVDLLAPGGKLVSYGMIAEEPISVHASTLASKSLTLRGKSIISGWPSEASPERWASDIVTAKQIALALTDQFDVAATYRLGELADAVEHAVRPGKVGTRPRPPLTAAAEVGGVKPQTILKTVVAAMSPWVQIPHPPQVNGP